MAGGKGGFVLSQRPKKYKILPQQERLREASESCGIKKGITRSELVDKMMHCVPAFFKQKREEDKASSVITSRPSS